MKAVHCLGVAVMDALSGPFDEYPVPRVRPQVNTRSIRIQAGGGAVNTSAALARMGLPAGLFCKIGRDPLGTLLLDEMAACGVDTKGICASAEDATPFTFVGVHTSGDRTFIHTPGANLTYTPEDIDLDLLFDCGALVYQDLFVVLGLEPRAPELLAEARRRGALTLLDECWGLGPDRERLERLLPSCDYVVPSADDMAALYPDLSASDIAAHLVACGAGAAVLKQGASGCLVVTENCTVTVPAHPAEVVDTTGAGDCWDAGFVAGLLDGADPVEAARLGCACAAFCIEAVGGSSGVPVFDDVKRRAGAR
jgi:sugar/nucleoside kinase (ribokinase family)